MIGLSSNTVIIQDQMSGKTEWLLFENPVAIMETNCIDQVAACLKTVEDHTKQGLYAAGFISYEASPAMDPAFETHTPTTFPLIWFGLYRKYEKIDLPEITDKNFELGEWHPSVSWEQYHAAITNIKQHILDGDTYQVNYTMRLRTQFSGDAWSLFLTLHQAQSGNYSAFINLGRYQICSVSPELFFSVQDGKIVCKPMKGTIKRGLTNAEDIAKAQWLSSSEKNRAENLMIVDMIRNDLGMLADIGTVRVDNLFAVEKYPTVHQMTSTVSAHVPFSIAEILHKMFPCASITGAPKVKTMEIIKNLEKDNRGIYTGSIGYITPEGKSQFNVAIRSVVLDMKQNSAEYGVGGGIIWDSEPSDEYEECKAKAAVLTHRTPEFSLLESILWNGEHGFYLLSEHLDRLTDSAMYFQFPLALRKLHDSLKEFATRKIKEKQKVRIEINVAGTIMISNQPVVSLSGYRVGLANDPISKKSHFLYHKTTFRETYDYALKNNASFQDVILWNEEGFITESCLANVVILDKGELITPPVNQGVLAGIFRRILLEKGIIKERSFTRENLLDASQAFLINSVRGWMPLEKDQDNDGWILKNDFVYQRS
jgi:para-aminobenzoate synthetase / 4-amino-4-deoxychorismate lyase